MGCAHAPAPAKAPSRPDLRSRLLELRAVDQRLRIRLTQGGGDIEALTQELRAKDLDHAREVRAMLASLGRWPGRALVGEEGAEAAWLLVQHADHDRALQELALDLLEPAVEAGEAPGVHLAYLQDRVLVAKGRPQRFGTQALIEDGGIVFHAIEDPEGVDERRAALGLPPLASYRRQLEAMYEGMLEERE